MTSKRVVWEISVKLMIKEHLERFKQKDVVGDNEFKAMKLFCVYLTDKYLVLGLNDGIVAIVTR
jgi:hypothetical protein